MNRKKTVITNMLWRFAERCGAQGVSFIVSLVLARLLLPEEYGIVSLITVFTAILNLFIDGGFKNALIQKKDADQLDFSTVFYFNVFLGVILYMGMFAVSPAIARFYGKPHMIPYIRVMSLTLVLGGVNGVQTAVVSKRMQFKRFFYATIGGTLVSAVVGIWMAYMGFGVWALIAQKLINQSIDTVILWFTVCWRPTLEFSFERLKPLFRYGSKILGSSILNSFTTNLTGLLIGKVYTAETLAYYEKGERIPDMVVANLHTAVQSVLFPVMANHQEQKDQVKRILRKSLIISTYCILPCMMGLAVCAPELIEILYTSKWTKMVPYIQLWCFSYAFTLMHTANLQVIQALGRSDIFLKLEIVKQGLSLILTLIALPFGVIAILIMECVSTVICSAINSMPNKKLVGYGFFEQIKDIFPILVLTIIMGAGTSMVNMIPVSGALMLMIKIVTGVAIYVAGSAVLKLESFDYMVSTLKEFTHK